METALYYTFSTIAQTLGGAIALLGGFVLYRFQLLARSIEDTAEYLRKEFKSKRRELHDKIDKARFDSDYRLVHEVSQAYSEEGIDPPTIQKYYSARARLDAMLGQKYSLFRYFNFSLIATVLLILGSVGVLANTPILEVAGYGSPTVFVIGSIWFAVCLYSFMVVVRKALEV